MKLAVLTTVYPLAEPFLDDFHRSLSEQDDHDFLLYVLDDGLGGVAERFPAFAGRLRVIPATGTPAAIRKQGLHALAADGIEGAVFADSDDLLTPNRVSWSRQMLATCRMVANELIAFGAGIDGRRPLLAPLLDEQRPLGWKDLLHGNLLGLSNTAAHVEDLLPHLGTIDDSLLAFDWALFTRALYPDGECRFTAQAATFYRQHAANIAGIIGADASAILRCVRVKAAHYTDLINLAPSFRTLAKGFARLRDRLETDPRYLADYVAYAAEQPAHGPWWSSASVPQGGFP